MRAVVMHAPGDVRVEDVAEQTIQKPTDAIIRLAATCICGSDLWPCRGADDVDSPRRMGHEYAGTPSRTQTPTATFTGDVLMTPLAAGAEPSRLSVALVRFTPGARTHWHVHPLGQLLHVTDGTALVSTRDGSVVRARAGDTVVCSPGEEHWHGAPADGFAAHLAIQEGAADGSGPVTWLEPVDDATYRAAQNTP